MSNDYELDPIVISPATNKSTVNSTIRAPFPTPLTLRNKQLGLAYLGIPHSWRNVSGPFTATGKTGWNNNRFGYYWTDNVYYPVNLPDGTYEISDLNNSMRNITMTQNKHFMLDADGNPVFFINFEANRVFYNATLECTPVAIPAGGSNPNNIPVGQIGKVPQLFIPADNNFGKLIGFNAGQYPATPNTTTIYYSSSQSVPELSPVSTVMVNCNLTVSRTSSFAHTIYTFSPNAQPARFIAISVPNVFFYNVPDGSYPDISLSFTDQNGIPLDIIDNQITATLFIRDKARA